MAQLPEAPDTFSLLPSSPLPSASRPSFDLDGVVAANQQVPPETRASAVASGRWEGGVYALDGLAALQPPPSARTSVGSSARGIAS